MSRTDRACGLTVIARALGPAILGVLLAGCATEPDKPVVAESDELYSGQPRAVYGTEFPAGSAAEAALRGDIALAKGDFDRALYFYVEAVRLEPEHVPTLLKIGAVHRRRGDDDRALASYRRVLAIEPDNAHALEGAGLVLLDRRAHDAARDLLDRAVARDPGRWRAYEGLGVLADLRGDHEQAIENYAVALKVQPGQASLYSNRGYSRYLAGDLPGAEADFRAALHVDPRFERAWRNLGLVHVRQQRFEEALKSFERVEDRAAALNDVGYLAMLEGHYGIAETYLSEALVASPTYYRVADENLERTRQRRAQAELAAATDTGK